MSDIYIIGHKNPDTDSIASAYAYAKLKQKIDPDNNYIAARCGNANNQTKYIFQRNNVRLPILVKDLLPKVADVMVSDVLRIRINDPVMNVFHQIEEHRMLVVPVVDDTNQLKGTVSMDDLIHLFVQEQIDQRPEYLFYTEHIPKAIKGSVFHKGKKNIFSAAIMVGTMSAQRTSERMDTAGAAKTLLIVGNRKKLLQLAVQNNVPCIIVAGVSDKNELTVDFSNYEGWVFLSSLDSAETIRRVILATPAHTIMNNEITALAVKDYLEIAKDALIKSHQRVLPVVSDGKLAGILSRSDVLKKYKNKVILVDHNEPGQAVEGIESTEVLEIIDHHRLGAVTTTAPVTYYAKPVGSTCTLIYQLYKNYSIKPDEITSRILMSGIISDTVMLKSPTTTEEDVVAMNELAVIANLEAKQYGIDIFTATDNLTARTAANIITTDFKIYTEYGIKIGIGQAEVVTLADFAEMRESLLKELDNQKSINYLNWAVLMVTDIIKEESMLLSTSFNEAEQRFTYKIVSPHTYFLPGILSRKKQLLPEILRIVEEMQ